MDPNELPQLRRLHRDADVLAYGRLFGGVEPLVFRCATGHAATRIARLALGRLTLGLQFAGFAPRRLAVIRLAILARLARRRPCERNPRRQGNPSRNDETVRHARSKKDQRCRQHGNHWPLPMLRLAGDRVNPPARQRGADIGERLRFIIGCRRRRRRDDGRGKRLRDLRGFRGGPQALQLPVVEGLLGGIQQA
jgi:hypothetical protein